ncbi:hypothetical protein [Flavobacterium sp.]|uniref:hypothetical protein n=1 Tax=Flavobacterium sp. TaxID=239 RepID=UPI003262DC68
MEKQNNHEYGQTDPDFIDQNTLVDGSNIQADDIFKQELNKEQKTEFGESDPDYIEQNTVVDTDNYAKDEDPYQYQEEFIEDLKHPANDFEKDKNFQSDDIIKNEKKNR